MYRLFSFVWVFSHKFIEVFLVSFSLLYSTVSRTLLSVLKLFSYRSAWSRLFPLSKVDIPTIFDHLSSTYFVQALNFEYFLCPISFQFYPDDSCLKFTVTKTSVKFRVPSSVTFF